MKKLFIIITFLFICNCAFSADKKEFHLYPVGTDPDAIKLDLLYDGWKMGLLPNQNAFTFEPDSDVYYYNQKITSYTCSFDKDEALKIQVLVLATPLSLSDVYINCMEIICKDKTILMDYKYPDTTADYEAAYYGFNSEYKMINYTIKGVDGQHFIAITYSNY